MLERLIGAIAATVVAAFGCAQEAPLVRVEAGRQEAGLHASLRVAVLPFDHDFRFAGEEPGGAAAETTAVLVSRHLSEALSARGVDVIPSHEMDLSFAAEGLPTAHQGARAAAEFAARYYGAQAVMLGTVERYRERSGEALGSEYPAAVAFSVRFYSAPDARLLWSAAFDEIQPSLMANPVRAALYPGKGARWLSAAEMSRFGAREVAARFVGAR